MQIPSIFANAMTKTSIRLVSYQTSRRPPSGGPAQHSVSQKPGNQLCAPAFTQALIAAMSFLASAGLPMGIRGDFVPST